MKKQVDLCVIGGAGAGLSCAVRAAELGVKNILVLEKMKNPGGCTRVASGIFGMNSPAHERAGITVDEDKAFIKAMNVAHWNVNSRLVRNWYRKSGQIIGWLEEKGLKFMPLHARPGQDPEDVTYHTTAMRPGKKTGVNTGNEAIKALLRDCETYGVEILTKTRAKKLITDDSGAVTGVEAESEQESYEITAKTVVIATGSISHSKELLHRFYPHLDFSDIYISAAFTHNTGDGLLMAEEIGAMFTPMSTLYIGPTMHPYDSTELHIPATLPEAIRVTRDGLRYFDESDSHTPSSFGWIASKALNAIPDYHSFTIINQGIVDYAKEKQLEQMRKMPPGGPGGPGGGAAPDASTDEIMSALYDGEDAATVHDIVNIQMNPGKVWYEDLEKDIAFEDEKHGLAKKCETLEEAAAFIGCPAQRLRQTIADYNSFCESGRDEEYLKPAKYLIPYEDKGPYYVIRQRHGIDTCIGGLRIDHELRVLDKQWRPIENLYAAGVVAGGFLGGDCYAFPGSEMGFVFYSGYTAGEAAAIRLGL